jgi:hypothetical protein
LFFPFDENVLFAAGWPLSSAIAGFVRLENPAAGICFLSFPPEAGIFVFTG